MKIMKSPEEFTQWLTSGATPPPLNPEKTGPLPDDERKAIDERAIIDPRRINQFIDPAKEVPKK